MYRMNPTIRNGKKKVSGKYVQAYVNVTFTEDSNVHTNKKTPDIENKQLSPEECVPLLPRNSIVLSVTSSILSFTMSSAIVVNGSVTMKEVTLNFHEKTWQMKIFGKVVNFANVNILETIDCTKAGLEALFRVIEMLQICTGVVWHEEECPAYCKIEEICALNDENSQSKYIRSNYCQSVLRLAARGKACTRCIAWNVGNKANENNEDDPESTGDGICLDEEDEKDMDTIINDVFPTASDDMKVLLQDQLKASKCDNIKARRWNPKVISLCLSMWTRSRRTYQTLLDSGMLVLPSGRTLQRHKNNIPSTEGVNQDMLRWMQQSAKQAKITAAGHHGGLIHDETKLQEDLVCVSEKGKMKLVGWVDLEEETFNLNTLKTKDIKRQLASECLQLVFHGFTGFRFPLANFPTRGAKASELYIYLWNAISKLADYGFYVDYILQDGGEQNREFAKMHFQPGQMITQCCLVRSLVDPQRYIGIIQDFSHVIKKMRNACLSSGSQADDGAKYTRKMQFEGQFIVWEHWVEAVKWDRDHNSRPLHYKASDTHLFPNPSEKMRNHLAEDMLDQNMLYLLKSYQAFLVEGEYLDSTIQFVEKTSILIDIFRDKRPICSVDDSRVQQMHDVSCWFKAWQESVEKAKMSKGEKRKSLPSWESMEDLQSLLTAFPKIIEMHLSDFPGSVVYPHRFNSDLVENHFCQERGVCNGNLTHPTYTSYCSSVGSIILTQSIRTRGRKSNAGIPSALEFEPPALQQPPTKKHKSSRV